MNADCLHWVSHGLTHTGNSRQVNQDAILNACDQKLWVVADGMGGHTAGEVASTAIIDGLSKLVLAKTIGTACKQVYQLLTQVNRNLLQLALNEGNNVVIGSTIAALLADSHYCIYLWSGDSRVYLFRNGCLQQITRDHNTENSLITEGFTPEEAKVHPYAQVLTHAIGAEDSVYIDSQIQEIKAGDIFLLCSDGLNKEVADSEIAAILKASALEESLSQLIDLALDRRGRDNISVILAQASSGLS